MAAGITVGATTRTDARGDYSNTGSCLDLFAPGSGVRSAWYTSDTATETLDGTSMAAPHVAGAAALLLESSPASTPAEVAARLLADATVGTVTDAGTGSPNRLLYTADLGTGITLVHDAVADSGQDFRYTGCRGGDCGDWVMDDDADGSADATRSMSKLAPGTYTISQEAVPGWTLTAIVCDAGGAVSLAERQVVITLAANQHVTCTFTVRSPSITLVHDTEPDSGQDFAYTGCSGDCGAPFALDDDVDSATPATVTAAGLAPGTYTLHQAAVPNWSLVSLSCTGGVTTVDEAARSVTLTIGPVDHVTCTWVSRSASLTIVQDTVPDGPPVFEVTGCSGACGAPVPLDDDPATPTPGRVRADGLAPGTYTVQQAAVPGWELFALSCDTGELADQAERRVTVVLEPGEQVTCTFANRRPPPANDDFADAQVVEGLVGSVTGTTVGATREPGEPGHFASGGAHSVWYRWTPTSSGFVEMRTCGSSFPTLVQVYRGTGYADLDPLIDQVAACGQQTRFDFYAHAGVPLHIAVDGKDGASGTVSFAWNMYFVEG